MKLLTRLLLIVLITIATFALTAGEAHAQFTIGGSNTPDTKPNAAVDEGAGPINTAPPKGVTPDQVIQRFATHEAEFREARDHYVWTQDVKIQELDGDTATGEFREVTDIVYNDQGQRIENVTFAPQPSLRQVSLTREDLDDIRNKFPFSLTPEQLPKYQILYVGQQKVDELDTYVFDVAPKTMEKGQRYFQGRIWVDSQDLQIVKSYGKSVPDIGVNPAKKKKRADQENLFPRFVTYRQQIDDKNWFPTYTKADDVLHFSNNDVHIRIIVKYENYKRFGSDVKILYGDTDITNQPPAGQKAPANTTTGAAAPPKK
jgi:hypothetical protein